MQDIVLFGVPLAGGALFVIVQEAKRLGVKGKGIVLARIAGAIALATLYEAYQIVPQYAGPVAEGLMVAVGMLLFAAGYRNASKDTGDGRA